MKHIKYTATPVGPKFDQVEVVIVEQSRVREEFGKYGLGCHEFKASNGLALYSANSPQIMNKATIRVWGSDPTKNGNKLIFTTSEYNKFREAVEEYNEFFKDKPKIKKPQVLRIHAEAIGPDFKNVSVEVVEQNCFEGQFGNRFLCEKIGDFVHGKVRLCSSVGGSGVKFEESFVPTEHRNKGLIGTFYVANNETKKDKDKLKTTVTVEVWQEILAAVEAYNKEFCSEVGEEVEVEVAEKIEKEPEAPKKRWFIRTKPYRNSSKGTTVDTVGEFVCGNKYIITVKLTDTAYESWAVGNCKEITEAELAAKFVEEKPEIKKDRYFVRTKINNVHPNFNVGLVGKVVKESTSGRSVTVVLPNGQRTNWLKENCVEITEIPVVEKKRWFVRTQPSVGNLAHLISSVGAVGELD